MIRQVQVGKTSVILPVFLQDSSSSTGAGLGSLVYNSSNLTCYYKRSNGTASVAVSLATIATLGTWETGGFKLIDNTHALGLYEFDPPDAAFASGAQWVVFYFQGATNLAPTPILIELTTTDNQVASGIAPVDLQTIKTQTVTAAAGVTFPASIASPTNITAASGIALDLTQSVPMVDVSADATLTTGKAMLGAWVQAAGDWSISGTTLTLKNPDGTTFRTFTLDSAVTPTSRT